MQNKSWKTTTTGVAMILGALSLVAVALFGSPEQVDAVTGVIRDNEIDWAALIAAVGLGSGGLGQILARDADQ